MLKFHRCLPVSASTATSCPSSPQKKPPPPAVETEPAHIVPGPVMGYCQRRSPVFGSSARRYSLLFSVGIRSPPPPAKPFIGTGSLAELKKVSHPSTVGT